MDINKLDFKAHLAFHAIYLCKGVPSEMEEAMALLDYYFESGDWKKFPDYEELRGFLVNFLLGNYHVRRWEIDIQVLAANAARTLFGEENIGRQEDLRS